MKVTLGLDFGTATTCVGSVRDAAGLAPVILPVDGLPFVDSRVWFDRPDFGRPLLSSRGVGDRVPLAVFQDADASFLAFWADRVRAQRDSAAWISWRSREIAMLMSFFKPELSDTVGRASCTTFLPGRSRYDPMGEFEEVIDYVQQRSVADSAPDAEDYLAATAVLLRGAVAAACSALGDRVSRLVIGVPALGARDGAELARAVSRRRDAVELAGIEQDFGASDFSVGFVPEAFAGAPVLGFVQSDEPAVMVIDVGAGTTDLSLVSYRRGPGGRWLPATQIISTSARYAGRDLNAAIASALRADSQALRRAFSAMDKRSWQLVLDVFIEEIKRNVVDATDVSYHIPVNRLVAHWEGSTDDNRRRAVLEKPVMGIVEYADVRHWTRVSARGLLLLVESFLSDASSALAGRVDRVERIAFVGGGLRFQPLRELLEEKIRASAFRFRPIELPTIAGADQTAVALGLARSAFLGEGLIPN